MCRDCSAIPSKKLRLCALDCAVSVGLCRVVRDNRLRSVVVVDCGKLALSIVPRLASMACARHSSVYQDDHYDDHCIITSDLKH